MTELQGWAVIVLLATAQFAMIGLTLRAIRADLAALRAELGTKLESLDRDVQRLYDRVFREGT